LRRASPCTSLPSPSFSGLPVLADGAALRTLATGANNLDFEIKESHE
jgi:hypothetical protein